MSDREESTPDQPEAEQQVAPENALLCLPDQAKPWFVAQLMNAGLTDIASDVHGDESREWFGRHYIGMLSAITQLTSVLQKVGVQAQVGGQKPPRPKVIAPEKKLILPS
jgi:hypothetical protein